MKQGNMSAVEAAWGLRSSSEAAMSSWMRSSLAPPVDYRDAVWVGPSRMSTQWDAASVEGDGSLIGRGLSDRSRVLDLVSVRHCFMRTWGTTTLERQPDFVRINVGGRRELSSWLRGLPGRRDRGPSLDRSIRWTARSCRFVVVALERVTAVERVT
ncbi:hypothetical protein BD309DRAFT_415452 [Dichomitus squalens]|uniref:Uncharacterized protein n=1 Tax=Dichomitus squalens TaxID=114155 RepID=A0A4Q9PLE2_9APHY|nr:hypothetical protein BD309DRAFT_415452 [Dichomitus squalens]TBU55007.1 hypothetical protein BD310DRAFT_718908 [Dichomitus squalens]